jgi:hypothetical protein
MPKLLQLYYPAPATLIHTNFSSGYCPNVGSYPVTGKADVLTGYLVWKLPEYMLHVGISVMEQRVNRVRIAAHPYYAPELLESPKLAAPVSKV